MIILTCFNSSPTHSTGPQPIQLGPKVLKGSSKGPKSRSMKKETKIISNAWSQLITRLLVQLNPNPFIH